MPEACLLGVEDLTATISHGLRSGKNMGRKIFGVLLLMAVLSVFLRFCFGVEWRKTVMKIVI